MAREYTIQIEAQYLEVRRLALTGPWRVNDAPFMAPPMAVAIAAENRTRTFDGPRAKARAVAYAEKMNEKEGGK